LFSHTSADTISAIYSSVNFFRHSGNSSSISSLIIASCCGGNYRVKYSHYKLCDPIVLHKKERIR